MAKQRLYKCYGCPESESSQALGRDFAINLGDEVVCPCGVKANEAAGTKYIMPCRVVHFEPPHANPRLGGTGCGKLACTNEPPEAGRSVMRTGDPGAVNCPACKATEAWQHAKMRVDEAAADCVEMVDLTKFVINQVAADAAPAAESVTESVAEQPAS